MCKLLRDLADATRGALQLPLELRRCLRLLEVRAYLQVLAGLGTTRVSAGLTSPLGAVTATVGPRRVTLRPPLSACLRSSQQ